MQKKLSLVIPTKNRFDVITSVLGSLKIYDSNEFELVVQDNSTNTSLGDWVISNNDDRIRYFHTDKPRNMHQNFDEAIKNASGEYICVIGDDDGLIVNEALAAIKIAQTMGADAILANTVSFEWPGISHPTWGNIGGRAAINKNRFHRNQVVLNTRNELKDLVKRGFVGGIGNLPRVYHGLVAQTTLDKVYSKTGTYFPGASPDMASSVALSLVAEKVYCHMQPIVISGHSPGSGGGQGSAGKHHGPLEDQKQLPKNTVSEWDDRLPRFWSATTIYAQAALMAFKALDEDLPTEPAFHKIYAACYVYEPKAYRDLINSALQIGSMNPKTLRIMVIFEVFRLTFRRGVSFIRNLFYYKILPEKSPTYNNIGEIMLNFKSHKELQ